MTNIKTALAQKANNLRIHSIISTTESGSGHPTTCMSAADIVSVLFFHTMRYDIRHAAHPNNDRFVLSKAMPHHYFMLLGRKPVLLKLMICLIYERLTAI